MCLKCESSALHEPPSSTLVFRDTLLPPPQSTAGLFQDNYPCTRRNSPDTHSDMSPAPAQAALDEGMAPPALLGFMSLQPQLISPTGIRVSLVTLLGALCWLSPLAALLLPHPPRDMAMSNAFSTDILCFTHSPCPFSLLPPPHLLHTTCTSSGLSRYNLSQHFAECCGERLCGNDSYRQRCYHLGRSTCLFQPRSA